MNVLKPHVSLNVTNIAASVAFYEKVFGVGATKLRPGYAKFDLKEPSLNLSMVENPPGGGGVPQASHFGIQVASSEDVAAAWTRFKEAGLETRNEDNTSCCYALQDKVWVKDPDGNEWEVFVVKGDTETMNDDPAVANAACCTPTQKAKASGGCCG